LTAVLVLAAGFIAGLVVVVLAISLVVVVEPEEAAARVATPLSPLASPLKPVVVALDEARPLPVANVGAAVLLALAGPGPPPVSTATAMAATRIAAAPAAAPTITGRRRLELVSRPSGTWGGDSGTWGGDSGVSGEGCDAWRGW